VARSSVNKALEGIRMKLDEEWDGYGSYEAYINRGLDGVFNTKQVKNTVEGTEQLSNKRLQQTRRIKPKTIYDIVDSYPHHKGDRQWLVDMLLRLPLAKRESVMLRYGQVYNSAHSAVTDDGGQAGLARRAGNEWLLGYVEQ